MRWSRPVNDDSDDQFRAPTWRRRLLVLLLAVVTAVTIVLTLPYPPVGVEVVAIGATSCGKPVGFLPKDNCGTTFSVVTAAWSQANAGSRCRDDRRHRGAHMNKCSPAFSPPRMT